MLVECPHCQGLAEVPPDHVGTVPCPECHRTFTVAQDPLLAGDVFDGSDPKAERSLLEPAAQDPFRHTAPPVGRDFARLTDHTPAAIGSIDFDSLAQGPVDLSILMDSPARPAALTPRAAVVNLGDLTAQPAPSPVRLRDEEESRRPQPVEGSAWRARTARGVVYELMSVDAVVAWLQGKDDLSGVRIARGTGDFLPVEAHPELANRLGLRGRSAARDDDDETLVLAEAPAVAPAAVVEREVSPLRAAGEGGEARARKPAHEPTGRHFGFGTVLAVALAAAGLMAGTVVLGLRTGFIPIARPVTDTVPLGPPSPELAAAIEQFEAGHLTAATQQLRALQGADADPRVYRYLALALAQSQQVRDADEALTRYRRSMLRLSGEHGRQVRELRD